MKNRHIMYGLVIITFIGGIGITMARLQTPVDHQYISDVAECKENGLDRGTMLTSCIELLELGRSLKKLSDDLEEFNREFTPGIDV